jgi:histidyl-tRNA synthetase
VFTGNIGEDEKMFYKFIDEGGRQVALRYDQTVPTCRFIAEHYSKLTFPFKRYQIQTVWRAEKPQKGRFREFLQCDADIFGLKNSESDAEVIALTIDIFKELGFKSPRAVINDRELYQGIPYKAIAAIDKLEKIGEEGVVKELEKKGYQKEEAKALLSLVELQTPNQNLKEIFLYLDNYGFQDYYKFKPTLARSFSYSTGTIWEIEVAEFGSGSLAGCERFDSLVSRFSNKQVPAVGFAIGFDRTIEAMTELNLFPNFEAKTKVLVTVFSKNTVKESLKIVKQLRDAKINSEIFSNPEEKLSNQLKYANKRQIPYVIIIGDEEIRVSKVAVKNMQTGEQTLLSELDLVDFLNR